MHLSLFAIFVLIFMKFSPKYIAKKLGMIYTILGSFDHFLIGKGPIFGPKSGLGKSPCKRYQRDTSAQFLYNAMFEVHRNGPCCK